MNALSRFGDSTIGRTLAREALVDLYHSFGTVGMSAPDCPEPDALAQFLVQAELPHSKRLPSMLADWAREFPERALTAFGSMACARLQGTEAAIDLAAIFAATDPDRLTPRQRELLTALVLGLRQSEYFAWRTETTTGAHFLALPLAPDGLFLAEQADAIRRHDAVAAFFDDRSSEWSQWLEARGCFPIQHGYRVKDVNTALRADSLSVLRDFPLRSILKEVR
jgi:hypothetical protein